MSMLETLVKSQVSDFIQRGEMFTALDVSNAVKATGIVCRHREVRDIVVASFKAGEFTGYEAGSIIVTLVSGDLTDALLYFPQGKTADEVEAEYGADKRKQIANMPPRQLVATVKLLKRDPRAFISAVGAKVKGFLSGSNSQKSDSDS